MKTTLIVEDMSTDGSAEGMLLFDFPGDGRAGERGQRPGAADAARDGARGRRRRPRRAAPAARCATTYGALCGAIEQVGATRRDGARCSDGRTTRRTAMEPLRVVCYVNQFFGQLGGEDKAGVGPQVGRRARSGAARAVQQALGDAGTVVATVLCGDNYVAEQHRARGRRAARAGRRASARSSWSRARRSSPAATASPAAPSARPCRRELGDARP